MSRKPTPGAPGTGEAPQTDAQWATGLQARAEALASGLPALLAEAERLAATRLLGDHGRRRSGMGDEFWQYRAAQPGDSARSIDWRRSARSDGHFLREHEWQAAQAVSLWVDPGPGMDYSGASARPQKRHRAQLLALAAASLLLRGGERVGLAGVLPPASGRAQLSHLGLGLARQPALPGPEDLPAHGRALLISDFLGENSRIDMLEERLARAADRGVRGVLLQVLDPDERAFPWDGRVIFEDMGGPLRHETLRADALRERYQERLAARIARLEDLGQAFGWRVASHDTSQPPEAALLWLSQALAGGM